MRGGAALAAAAEGARGGGEDSSGGDGGKTWEFEIDNEVTTVAERRLQERVLRFQMEQRKRDEEERDAAERRERAEAARRGRVHAEWEEWGEKVSTKKKEFAGSPRQPAPMDDAGASAVHARQSPNPSPGDTGRGQSASPPPAGEAGCRTPGETGTAAASDAPLDPMEA